MNLRTITAGMIWITLTVCFALPATVFCQQADLVTETDIVYGIADGKPLTLDVYRLPGRASRSAIIFIHGGGWRSGDKNDFRDLAQGFARRGYVCFSVNYRLMTDTPTMSRFPDQLDDVQRAVRWIRSHAANYGIDGRRIGAMGGSAGGHLVALLGVLDTRASQPPELRGYPSRAQCVVDLFGPTDLTAQFPVSRELDVQKLIRTFLGGTAEQKPEAYRAASPIFHIDASTAQFLIFHGVRDPLVPVDQSRRFVHALQEKDVSVTYVEFPDEGHGIEKQPDREKFVSTSTHFFDSCLEKSQ